MNDKEIIVNYNVDIVAYSAAVQDIAKKFFDEDGNYTPHFGRANAVGVFFNYFVDDVSLAAYFSDVDGDLDLDYLLNNAQVVGTPGAGFGENGKNFFRLTAFGGRENTIEAMERFDKLF